MQELASEGTLTIPVYGVNVAEAAPDREADQDAQGKSLRDHLWLLMWRWLRVDAPVFAADREACEDLAGELSTVKYAPDSNGRLVIESKDAMKARHLRSPDLADALALTFAPQASMIAISISPTEMEHIWREAGFSTPSEPTYRRIWGDRPLGHRW